MTWRVAVHLILPKTHPDLEAHRALPMFFLAGPIRGAGDWHVPMSHLLMERFQRLIVVNPSRYQHEHPFSAYRMVGEETRFKHQTDWERYYLEQAAQTWPSGCIIFWLALQKEARDDGEAYARDTRGEIGEWRGRMMHNPNLRVIVGAEKDFPGLKQIKRNFELSLPNFTIHDSMEQVVEHAALLVRAAQPL